MDRAHYCQLWNRNRALNDLVPSDGTFLPGSEHTLDSDGWNGFTGNIDSYYWADQNFQGMASYIFFFLEGGEELRAEEM